MAIRMSEDASLRERVKGATAEFREGKSVSLRDLRLRLASRRATTKTVEVEAVERELMTNCD